MATERIQVDYQRLGEISSQVENRAEEVQQLYKQIDGRVENLRSGHWTGVGAQAFFREMEGEVLPALRKLAEALQSGSETVNEVAAVFSQAEEVASQPFLQESNHSWKNDFPGRLIFPFLPWENVPSIWIDLDIPVELHQSVWENSTYLDSITGGASGGSWGDSTIVSKVESSFWDKIEFGGFAGKEGYFSDGFDQVSDKLGMEIAYHDSLYDADDMYISKKILGYEVGGTTYDMQLGDYKGGIGFGVDDGQTYAGLIGEFTTAEFSGIDVIGGSSFGVYNRAEIDLLEGEAFVGYKEGNMGAMIGGNLVEFEGSTGFNIIGYRIGIKGSAGVGFSLGVIVGTESKVKFGPFGVGLSIGKAYETSEKTRAK